MEQQHGKLVDSINPNDYNNQSDEEQMDLRRGPWTVEEDFTLINYIAHHGEGRWNSLARCAGLKRTGKSCRLRWLNYLRPDVRRGNITLEEQLLILELHSRWGNRWSKIAQHLPGRTDNEIKNYWRTRVQKHAKQLKCDVNSKQFKDTMRYLWMPRLVERIQAAAAAGGGGGAAAVANPVSSTSTATNYGNIINNFDDKVAAGPAAQIMLPQQNINIIDHHHGVNTYTPENSSAAASSDSFGTPVSDLTECYNNYTINQGNNNNQDYNYPANNQLSNCGGGTDHHHHHQSLTSPTGNYFNQQGFDFMDHQQNSPWMDGGDVSDNFWSVDDIWFLQQQFNSTNV